jgi:hypothetical protein
MRKEQAMNNQLPNESQKVQVKLMEGDWQDAVFREKQFVDLYGLPLDADKVLEWRPLVLAAQATKPAAHARRNMPGAAATPAVR